MVNITNAGLCVSIKVSYQETCKNLPAAIRTLTSMSVRSFSAMVFMLCTKLASCSSSRFRYGITAFAPNKQPCFVSQDVSESLIRSIKLTSNCSLSFSLHVGNTRCNSPTPLSRSSFNELQSNSNISVVIANSRQLIQAKNEHLKNVLIFIWQTAYSTDKHHSVPTALQH